MIPIKNDREIECMRRSCQTAASIRDQLAGAVRPGVSTKELDDLAKELIAQAGGVSPFFGYGQRKKFPGQICVSINEEVVHGIGGARRLELGDIVKLDVGIVIDGWIGDTAITVSVGMVSPEVNHLMHVTLNSLYEGIAQAKVGNHVHDIGARVESFVTENGCSVVREFVGHGVGKRLHEEPQVPNFGKPKTGPKLKAGMILAIEPMVNLGKGDVHVLPDGWTVVASDKKPSAHFEHTVLITDGEPEILTWSERMALK